MIPAIAGAIGGALLPSLFGDLTGSNQAKTEAGLQKDLADIDKEMQAAQHTHVESLTEDMNAHDLDLLEKKHDYSIIVEDEKLEHYKEKIQKDFDIWKLKGQETVTNTNAVNNNNKDIQIALLQESATQQNKVTDNQTKNQNLLNDNVAKNTNSVDTTKTDNRIRYEEGVQENHVKVLNAQGSNQVKVLNAEGTNHVKVINAQGEIHKALKGLENDSQNSFQEYDLTRIGLRNEGAVNLVTAQGEAQAMVYEAQNGYDTHAGSGSDFDFSGPNLGILGGLSNLFGGGETLKPSFDTGSGFGHGIGHGHGHGHFSMSNFGGMDKGHSGMDKGYGEIKMPWSDKGSNQGGVDIPKQIQDIINLGTSKLNFA